MITQHTAGDRRGEMKKAAGGSAAFSDECREHPDPSKIGPAPRSVNNIRHGAAARLLGDARRAMAPGTGRARSMGYWRNFGFLAANALTLFRPGRYFEPGRKVPRRWPEATVENALGAKDSPARLAIEALVDQHGCYLRERILDAVAAGMADGERWTRKHRRLVSPQEAAKRLGVSFEERRDLGLRLIGAADMSPKEMKIEAKREKREHDREAKAAERRAAGVQRREDYERNSISKARPWEALGVSRATYYRRLKEADGRAETGVSLHNNDPVGIIDNSLGDTPVSRPTTTHNFSIDEGAAQTLGPSSSMEKVERSETTIQLAALEKNIQQRLPAPHGADCRRADLSLSDRALLALYAREKSAGRVREVAR